MEVGAAPPADEGVHVELCWDILGRGDGHAQARGRCRVVGRMGLTLEDLIGKDDDGAHARVGRARLHLEVDATILAIHLQRGGHLGVRGNEASLLWPAERVLEVVLQALELRLQLSLPLREFVELIQVNIGVHKVAIQLRVCGEVGADFATSTTDNDLLAPVFAVVRLDDGGDGLVEVVLEDDITGAVAAHFQAALIPTRDELRLAIPVQVETRDCGHRVLRLHAPHALIPIVNPDGAVPEGIPVLGAPECRKADDGCSLSDL
mmetsp:Transcript_27567/g.74209  ORF Transcript_27567/g.74209 Transcript_27567/m.74209 type:complete len:263 (-) Transcript_27567:175-963(-)